MSKGSGSAYGGEAEFEWKGNQYTICHPDGRINIGDGCYEKDGKYYNMNTNQEYAPEDEMWGDTADDILEYNVGEINFGMWLRK